MSTVATGRPVASQVPKPAATHAAPVAIQHTLRQAFALRSTGQASARWLMSRTNPPKAPAKAVMTMQATMAVGWN